MSTIKILNLNLEAPDECHEHKHCHEDGCHSHTHCHSSDELHHHEHHHSHGGSYEAESEEASLPPADAQEP
jgi:hypothetical protein